MLKRISPAKQYIEKKIEPN